MTDSFIIKNLLGQPEGERLEFKSTIVKNAIAQVITSLINTKGGDLLIGINDDKSVADVNLNENDRKNIEQFLITEIKPTAPIYSRLETYKNKSIIMISVWEGANKPYHFKNKIFVRRGSQTVLSKDITTANLLNERRYSEQRWERQAVLGASLNDLDIEEIKKTMTAYKNYSSAEFVDDEKNFLVNRGLIINGNITNACMVLFGKNPVQFIPQSKIKLVVHPGTSSSDAFIENKIFEGNILKNIEVILSHFDSIIGKEIKIEGIYRKEQKRYPEKALREGLLNAIVHRDYSISKAFLTISIYSNRLVISNYGGLPDELTVKDLTTEHNSILRNPDIAQMCFYNGLIEMLGTGTLRMIRNCKEEGFRMPKWKNKDNILELTFPNVHHNQKGNNLKAEESTMSESLRKDVGRMSERCRKEFGVTSALVLIEIAKNQGITIEEIARKIDKSTRTIERTIEKLKQVKIIKRQGAKLGGFWEINFDNN